jgi:hypothetical protein
MLTTTQLLNGLVALLGQMIGRMPSPEFLIPVLVAFRYSAKPWHILAFAVPCAFVGSIVWLIIGNPPRYVVGDFLVRYLGSVIVIAILYGGRTLIRHLRRSRSKAAGY